MKNKPYRFAIYILIRTIGFLLYPFPLKISRAVCAFFGRVIFYILPKERKKTLGHLRHAFGGQKDEGAIRAIALRLFSNLGRNAAEWLNFYKFDKGWYDTFVDAEGLDNLRQAYKRKKGIIVLASHFGNWELMAAYYTHIGCTGAIIARRIYIEEINKIFVDMRTSRGNEVIYRDESPKKVLRVLKNNGFIGLLPDQDVDSVEGVFVDFFGRPAYTPVAPVKFAGKTGAALMPTFLIRDGERFRFVVEREFRLKAGGDPDRDMLINTERWMKVIENYIREYPDQWVWMHRRWKTRPKTATAEKMAAIDKAAQEDFKIPGIDLMESAGKAAAAIAMDMLKESERADKTVAVFCGKGNNGGDGLVVSRRLCESGLDVTTYILRGERPLKNAPAANLARLEKTGSRIITLKEGQETPSADDLSGHALIVDAIFGTGFKGASEGTAADIISAINGSGVTVLSVDVPSGLDATTGEREGVSVKASETVTFGLPKTGFYLADGPGVTGRIIVKKIAFPEQLL